MIKYGCNGTREVSFKTKITYITYINNIENRDQSYVADISFRHLSSIVIKSEPGPSQPINYTYAKHYMKEQYG